MNATELEALVLGTDQDAVLPPETAVDGDGWIYRLDTGEVVGKADVAPHFTVDSVEAAEWALELRSRIEGDIAGIDARRKALVATLDALRREQVRRLSWWEWRFGPSLVAFARARLVGKARTARFGWGTVAFRTSPGTHQILDPEAAVAWVKDWAPAKVQRKEWVTIRDVLATIEVVARATGEPPERPPFLAATGHEESVRISTGIELDANERG